MLHGPVDGAPVHGRVGGQQAQGQPVALERVVEQLVIALKGGQAVLQRSVGQLGQFVGKAVIGQVLYIALPDEVFQPHGHVLGVPAHIFFAEMELSAAGRQVDGRIGYLLHLLVIVGKIVHRLTGPVGIAGKAAHETRRKLPVALGDLFLKGPAGEKTVHAGLAVMKSDAAEEGSVFWFCHGDFCHAF